MNRKLKFRTRIALGFLFPCLVFGAAIAAVYWQMRVLQEAVNLREQAAQIATHEARFALNTANMIRDARGYILVPEHAAFFDAYQQAKHASDDELGQLRRLVISPGQVAKLDSMQNILGNLAAVLEPELDLVKQGQVAQAQTIVRSGHSEVLSAQLDTVYREFNTRDLQIESERSLLVSQRIDVSLLTLEVALAVALALSLAGALLITRNVTRGLSLMIGTVASSTAEMAASAAEHEGTMAKQASAVSQTTTSLAELTSTAQQSLEQVEAAARAAEETRRTMDSSLPLSEQTLASMGKTVQTMDAIAQGILRLSEQAEQIGEISRVVASLAANTNMLALNAAVEAARAGEQGRGFAVVASEIRKLAEQSRASATRANEIVSDIQGATNKMVMMTEDGARDSSAAAQSSAQTNAALVRVRQLAESVSDNAQQVMQNSRQQSTALSQIEAAMNAINNGARDMFAGISQSRLGNDRLLEAADQLKREL